MNIDKKAPKLITMVPSHYCEKVRWAMEYLELDYVDDAHPPLFHLFSTTINGGKSVPVLVTEKGKYTDSTDILKYLNSLAPDNKKLYPTDENLKKEVEELEDFFDTKLGPHSRRWAYYYLLEKPELLFRWFCQGKNMFEETGFKIFFPIIKQLMKKGMNINQDSAERSKNKINEVFKTVDEKLSDGRKYLTGNFISAADITFSALAAPLVMPSVYAGVKADVSEVPEQMAREVEEFRKTKAGTFALELFESRFNNQNLS